VFINADTVEELLEPEVDVVVDAIDSVSSKVNLIVAAYEKGYPGVTSMGAGGRIDSSQIHAGDISESTVCPLAKIIRKRLHRRGVFEGIRCVYSVEPAENKLPYNEEDADEPQEHGRQRTPIGTISYMPGIFGLKVAEEVIRLILNK
jgi:tRNA A37 threonylcarbamoyladenosine dehydratase